MFISVIKLCYAGYIIVGSNDYLALIMLFVTNEACTNSRTRN